MLDLDEGRVLRPWRSVDVRAGELEQRLSGNLDLERAVDLDLSPDRKLERLARQPAMGVGAAEPQKPAGPAGTRANSARTLTRSRVRESSCARASHLSD